MNPAIADDIGKLILRLTLGILLLFHGIPKLFGGVGGIAGMLEGVGLPSVFAYGVLVGEVLGPILVLIGWYARVGAGLIAINMLVALALVHSHELFQLSENGALQLERQYFFLFVAVALAFAGPGRFSVNRT